MALWFIQSFIIPVGVRTTFMATVFVRSSESVGAESRTTGRIATVARASKPSAGSSPLGPAHQRTNGSANTACGQRLDPTDNPGPSPNRKVRVEHTGSTPKGDSWSPCPIPLRAVSGVGSGWAATSPRAWHPQTGGKGIHNERHMGGGSG